MFVATKPLENSLLSCHLATWKPCLQPPDVFFLPTRHGYCGKWFFVLQDSPIPLGTLLGQSIFHKKKTHDFLQRLLRFLTEPTPKKSPSPHTPLRKKTKNLPCFKHPPFVVVCLVASGGRQDHLERNLVEARNLRAARGTPCEPTNCSKTGTAGGVKVWKGKVRELVDSPHL